MVCVKKLFTFDYFISHFVRCQQSISFFIYFENFVKIRLLFLERSEILCKKFTGLTDIYFVHILCVSKYLFIYLVSCYLQPKF